MSLIRNNRNRTDQTLTAKRFVAGQPIESNSYRPLEYIQVLGKKFWDGHNFIHVNSVSTIIIKAQLQQNADGYLMGAGVTSSDSITPVGLQIYVHGGTVQWIFRASTQTDPLTLYQVNIEEGPHLYGYLHTVDNGIVPYYDRNNILPASPSSKIETVPIATIAIGSLTEAGLNGEPIGDCMTGTGWAVRVYEVIGNLYYYYYNESTHTAEEEMTICHWYATKTTRNVVLHETRSTHSFDLGAGSQDVYIVEGPDVTYGMQLDDLKELTHSRYKDLNAILTEDGGIDVQAGFKTNLLPTEFSDFDRVAATAETFTKDDILRSVAFYLPAGRIKGVSSVTPPTGTWEEGQLFKGRTPRWCIWNDAIKFGKHIVGGMNSTDKKILFNVFKDFYGRNILTYQQTDIKKIDPLIAFDGYNNTQTTRTKGEQTVSNGVAGYPPFIEVLADTTNKIEFHCDTAYDTTITSRSYQWTPPYIEAFATSSVTSSIRACLGGIPFWQLSRNYGSSEAHANDFDVYDITGDITAQAPTIYGLLCKIQSRNAETPDGWADIASATAVTDESEKYPDNQYIPLSKDSSQAMVNKFKINGAELTLQYIGYEESLRVNIDDEFIARAKMYAMLSRSTSSIPATSIIDCSSLVAPQPVNIMLQRNFDSLMLVGEDTYGSTTSGEKIYFSIARQYIEANAFTFPINGQIIDQTSVYNVTWETICGIMQLKRGDSFLPIFGEFHTITDWDSFFLTGDSNKVIVNSKSNWPTTGDSSCHYVDSDNYTIWHWDSYDNEYYEDALYDVTSQGESFVRDYEDPEYDFTFKIRGSDNYGPYIKYYRFSEQKVGQGKTGLNRYAITQVRDYMDCNYVAYIEMTSFRSWQSMLGAPSDKLHIVKGLPKTGGTAGHYYVNVNNSRIYQRVSVSGTWTWVEDAEENVASINELLTKTDYHKTYHLSGTYRYFRRSEIAVLGGKTGIDTFIELPQWFSRGVCLGRYSGFANIFNQLTDTTQMYIAPQGGSQVWNYSAEIRYPTERSTTIGLNGNDKFGVFTFYKPYLARDVQQQTFDTYPNGSEYSLYSHEPISVRLRIFNTKSNQLPWSWFIYKSANVSFSDQGENWFIGLDPTTIGSTTYYQKGLLVINNSFLISGGRSVVGIAARAYVLAENGGYNEVQNYNSYFTSFRLSLYKQTPCEPCKSDGKFDKNLQMTSIFTNMDISVPASQYGQEVRISGTYYSIKISVINYSGMAFGLTNEPVNKFMNYNTQCYYIEIINDYNPDKGVTYVARIEPN